LTANKDNKSFRQCVVSQFNVKTTKNITYNLAKRKQANILKVSPPISPRPSKSILAKSKFFKKNSTLDPAHKSNKQLSAQIFKNNIRNIIKIKETFPKLSSQKVSKIYKV